MISKFLGAVVVGSLILPVPADAGSAVGKTNAGGKYVHYGRTNPGGKWLELWYQPKIETRALVMRGAEALSRVRHPAWGIVPPAYFAPEDSGSPDAVSDAVISRAVEDWHRFFAQSGPIEIGINLPTAVLTDSEAIGRLCKQLPNHAAFEGLIVEVNSAELIRNLDLAMRAARQLRLHKVAIAIDDAGPEWL
jgi:EAL domain-containing protein (putative c-di-GMP-specific phosphodiesterase class I)